MECNEINNAVFNFFLERQHVNVHALAEQSSEVLEIANHEGDFGAIFDKLVWLVVSKLHDDHALSDFRVEQQVQRQG